MRKKTLEEIREANRLRQQRWRHKHGPMNRLRAKNGYWEARGGRPETVIKDPVYEDIAMSEGDPETVRAHREQMLKYAKAKEASYGRDDRRGIDRAGSGVALEVLETQEGSQSSGRGAGRSDRGGDRGATGLRDAEEGRTTTGETLTGWLKRKQREKGVQVNLE